MKVTILRKVSIAVLLLVLVATAIATVWLGVFSPAENVAQAANSQHGLETVTVTVKAQSGIESRTGTVVVTQVTSMYYGSNGWCGRNGTPSLIGGDTIFMLSNWQSSSVLDDGTVPTITSVVFYNNPVNADGTDKELTDANVTAAGLVADDNLVHGLPWAVGQYVAKITISCSWKAAWGLASASGIGTAYLHVDVLPKYINLDWGTTTIDYNGDGNVLVPTINPDDIPRKTNTFNASDPAILLTVTASLEATKDNGAETVYYADVAQTKPAGVGEYYFTIDSSSIQDGNGTNVSDRFNINNNRQTLTIRPVKVSPIMYWEKENISKSDKTFYNGEEQGVDFTFSEITNSNGEVRDDFKLFVKRYTDSTYTTEVNSAIVVADDYYFKIYKATINNQEVNLGQFDFGGKGAQKLVIAPAQVYISWSDIEVSYNGDEHVPSARLAAVITKNNGVDVQPFKVQIARKDGSTDAPINAGSYAYEVTGIVLGDDEENLLSNFAILGDTEEETLAISKASISISWGELSVSYNGQEHEPTAQIVEDILKNDKVTPAVFVSKIVLVGRSETAQVGTSGKPEGVGIYNYKVDQILNSENENVISNFSIKNSTADFRISESRISITWTNDTRSYNGKTQRPTAAITSVIGNSGTNVANTFTVEIGRKNSTNEWVGDPKDAGTYTFEVSAIKKGTSDVTSYFTIESNQSHYFIINPLSVSFKAQDAFTTQDIFDTNGVIVTTYGKDVLVDGQSIMDLDLIDGGYFKPDGENRIFESYTVSIRLRLYDSRNNPIATISNRAAFLTANAETYNMELSASATEGSAFNPDNYVLSFDNYLVKIDKAEIIFNEEFQVSGFTITYDEQKHDVLNVMRNGASALLIDAIQTVNRLNYTLTYSIAELDYNDNFEPSTTSEFESIAANSWVAKPVQTGSLPQVMDAGKYAVRVQITAENHEDKTFYFFTKIEKTTNSFATHFSFMGSSSTVYPIDSFNDFDKDAIVNSAWTFGIYDANSNPNGYSASGNQKVVAPVLAFTHKTDNSRLAYSVRIWQYNAAAATWTQMGDTKTQQSFLNDNLIQTMLGERTFYAGYYIVEIFAEVAATENYTSLYGYYAFKVAKQTLTIKAKDLSIQYGFEAHPEVSIHGLVQKDATSEVDTLESLVNTGTDYYSYKIYKEVDGSKVLYQPNKQYGSVGTYTIESLGFVGNSYFSRNYDFTYETATLTVTKRIVEIRIDNQENYYNFQGANNQKELPCTLTYTVISENGFLASDTAGEYTFYPAERIFFMYTAAVVLKDGISNPVKGTYYTSKTPFADVDTTNNQGQHTIFVQVCDEYAANYQINQSGVAYYIIKSAVFGISWGFPHTGVWKTSDDTTLSTQSMPFNGKEYWYAPKVQGFDSLNLIVEFYVGSVLPENLLKDSHDNPIAPTNAGSYIAVARVSDEGEQGDSNNWQTSSATFSFSILPATVNVTADQTSVQYGTKISTMDDGKISRDLWTEAGNRVETLDCTLTCATYTLNDSEAAAIKALVSYTTNYRSSGTKSKYGKVCTLTPGITAVPVDSDSMKYSNFTFTFSAGVLTVQQREITVRLNGYNSAKPVDTSFATTEYVGYDVTGILNNKLADVDLIGEFITIVEGNLASGDTLFDLHVQLSFLRSDIPVNVGEYQFEPFVSAAQSTNYSVSFVNADVNRAKFAITPKALTVTPALDGATTFNITYGNTLVYGPNENAANTLYVGYLFNGLVDGDDYALMGGTLTSGSLVFVNNDYQAFASAAGTSYTLTFDIKAGSLWFKNYNVTAGTATVNVVKRGVRASVTDNVFLPLSNPTQGQEQNANVSFIGISSISGYSESYAPQFTSSYKQNGVSLSGVPSDAGNYKVTITMDATGNYILENGPEFDYRIEKLSLAQYFKWQTSRLYYNGTDIVTNTATGLNSALFDLDTLKVFYEGTELTAGVEYSVNAAAHTLTVTIDNNLSTSTGEYTATVQLIASAMSNYQVTGGSFSITFETLQVAVVVNASINGWTYGSPSNAPQCEGGLDSNANITYSYTKLSDSDLTKLTESTTAVAEGKGSLTAEEGVKFSYGLASAQNAGYYILCAKYKGSDGTAYSYYLFTVEKKTVAAPTISYAEGQTSDTYTGRTLTKEIIYTDNLIGYDYDSRLSVVQNGNKLTFSVVNATTSGYEIKFSLYDEENYKWDSNTNVADNKVVLRWQVAKATNSVTFVSTEISTVYGTEFGLPTVNATFGANTVVFEYYVNSTWTSTRPRLVGDYNVRAYIPANGNNYDRCETADSIILHITKKDIVVTPTIEGTATYGQLLADINFGTVQFAGFVYGDTSVSRNGNPTYLVGGVAATGTATAGDIGNYIVTIQTDSEGHIACFSSNNYNFVAGTANLEVVRRAITIDLGAISVQYTVDYSSQLTDEKLLNETAINSQLVNGDTAAALLFGHVNYSTSADLVTDKEVNSYVIYASCTLDNYTVSFNNGILVITQLEIGVTLTTQNAVYGSTTGYVPVTPSFFIADSTLGAAFDPDTILSENYYLFTYTKAVSGSNGAISYQVVTDGTEKTNAGSYSATLALTNSNLRLSSKSVNFANYTIAKKTLNAASITINSAVYDGQSHTPVITDASYTSYYTTTGLVAQTEANESGYPVTLTLKDPDNIQWSTAAGKDLVLSFVISKANNELVAGTELTIADWTYGSAPSAPSLELKFDENVTMNVLYSEDNVTWTSVAPQNARSYYGKIEVSGNDNVNAFSTSSVSFRILPQMIDVPTLNVVTSGSGKNDLYTGETLTLTVNDLQLNSAKARVYDIESVGSSVRITYESVGGKFNAVCQTVNAGDHELHFVLTDSNYKFRWVDSENTTHTADEYSATWKVQKAENEIYLTKVNVDYGTEYTLEVSTKFGSGATVVYYDLDGTTVLPNKPVGAGTYKVSVSLDDHSPNYTAVSATVNDAIVINKVDLTVTITFLDYDTSVEYDSAWAKNPYAKFSYTVSGFVNGEREGDGVQNKTVKLQTSDFGYVVEKDSAVYSASRLVCGTYTVKFAENSFSAHNYNINYSGTNNFVVVQRALDEDDIRLALATFNNTDLSVTDYVTLTGEVLAYFNEGAISATNFTGATVKNANLTGYDVKFTITDSNLKWASTAGNDYTVKLVVEKATNSLVSLSVQGWDYSKYDDAQNAPTSSFNFAAGSVAGSVSYEYSTNGGSSWISWTATTLEILNAGTYYVRATVAENDNVKEYSATASFSVSQLAIATPTISGEFFFQVDSEGRAKEQSVTVNFEEKGALIATAVGSKHTVISSEESFTVRASEADTYYITFSLVNPNNYILSGTPSTTWTIKKATDNQIDTSATVTSFSYSGQEHPVVATAKYGTVTYTYYRESVKLQSAPVNAGTYTVVIAVEDGSNNYNDVSTSITMTIDKVAVTVTPAGTMVYGGSDLNRTFTEVTGLVGSDTLADVLADKLNLTYTVYGSDNTSVMDTADKLNAMIVGNYKITVSGSSTNYTITGSADNGFRVLQRNLKVAVGNSAITYRQTPDLSAVSLTIFEGELVNGHTLEDLALAASFDSTAVVTDSYGYIMTSIYEGVLGGTVTANSINANYNITFIKGSLTVDKLQIEVDFAVSNGIYSEQAPVLTVNSVRYGATTVTDIAANAWLELTYYYVGATLAGQTYSSEVMPQNAGNYTVSVSTGNTGLTVIGSTQKSFAIGKMNLDESKLSVLDGKYNAQAQTVTVVYDNNVANANPYASYYTQSTDEIVNAGTHEVTLTINADYAANVQWKHASGASCTLTMTVEKATVTVNVSAGKSFQYGSSKTGNICEYTLSVDSMSELPSGVTVEFFSDAFVGNTTADVGNSYSILATVSDSTNYQVVVADNGFHVTILPKNVLAPLFTDPQSSYTGSIQTVSIPVVEGVKLDSTTVDITGYQTETNYIIQALQVSEDANGYKIVFGLVNGNYAWDDSVQDVTDGKVCYLWKISKVAVTIDVSSIPSEMVYTGSNVSVSASASTNAAISYTFFKGATELSGAPKDAGDYIVVASVAEARNYSSATAQKNFRIVAKELTVTPSGSVVFGNAWNSGSLSYTITGFVDGKSQSDVTVVTAPSYSIENIGSGPVKLPVKEGGYTLQMTAEFSLANYSFKFVDGSFTVNRKVLDESTLLIRPQDYTGSKVDVVVCNGDINTLDTNGDFYTVSDPNAVNAGSYSVTLTVDTDNVIWTSVVGGKLTLTLTVNKIANSGTIAAIDDLTYGDAFSAPQVTLQKNLEANEELVFAYHVYDESKVDHLGSKLGGAPVNAGKYCVTLEVGETTNFTGVTSNIVVFEIKPFQVEAPSIGSTEYIYNGQVQTLNIAVLRGVSLVSSTVDINSYQTADNYVLQALQVSTDTNGYKVVFGLQNGNYTWKTGVTTNASDQVELYWKIQKATNVEIYDSAVTDVKYSGSAVSFNITSSIGDDVVLSYYQNSTLLTGAPTDVGSYRVVMEVSETRNYAAASKEASFEITAAELTVTPTGTVEFGKAWDNGTLNYVITGFVDGKSQSDVTVTTAVSYSVAGENSGVVLPVKDGGYTLNMTGAFSLNNYTFKLVGGTLTVTRKVLDESNLLIKSQDYTGSNVEVKVCNGDENTLDTNGQFYTVAAITAVNAGTYNVTLTVNLANVRWTYAVGASITLPMTVNKIANSGTIAAIDDLTYGDVFEGPQVTLQKNLEAGEALTFVYYRYSESATDHIGGKLGSFAPTNAGKYCVRVETGATTNFTSVTSDIAVFEIKPLAVDAPSLGNPAYTYNGQVQTLNIPVVNGVVLASSNVDISSYQSTDYYVLQAMQVSTDTNGYKALFELQSANYTWKTGVTTNASNQVELYWKIQKASDVEILHSAVRDSVYSGRAVSFNVTSSIGATVVHTYYKDSVAEANKLTGAPKDVGSYIVVLKVAETRNYAEATEEVTFQITEKELTVTPNGSVTYGTDWQNGTFGYVITGFVDGKSQSDVTVTSAITSDNYTVVGAPTGLLAVKDGGYTLRMSGTFSLDNYKFNLVDGVFTVNKLVLDESALLIRPQDYTGSNVDVVVCNGNVDTEDTNGKFYEVSTVNAVNAGSYNVTLSVDFDNVRWTYTVSKNITLALTVKKIAMTGTIAAFDQLTYGDSYQTTATLNNNMKLEAGESLTFGYYSYDGSQANHLGTKLVAAPVNAGKYCVRIETGATTNFTGVTSDIVEFEIKPLAVEAPQANFTAATYVYNGLTQTLQIVCSTGTALKSCDATAYQTATGYDIQALNANPTGYQVVFELQNSNYIWKNVEAGAERDDITITWKIEKAIVQLDLSAFDDVDYTGKAVAATAIARMADGTVVANVSINFDYYEYDAVKFANKYAGETPLQQAPKNVGKYVARASAVDVPNYQYDEDWKVFEIEKAVLIAVPTGSITYNETVCNNLAYTIDWSQLMEGDTRNNIGLTGTAVYYIDDVVSVDVNWADLAAGSYKLTVEGLTAQNYEVVSTDSKNFTVNIKKISENSVTVTTAVFDGTDKVYSDFITVDSAVQGYLKYDLTVSKKNAGHYNVDFEIVNPSVQWENTQGKIHTVVLEIEKGTNSIDGGVIHIANVDSWTFGDNLSHAISASVTFDNDEHPSITPVFQAEGSEVWTPTVPTDAGTYNVKLQVVATSNCNAFTSSEFVEFTIKPQLVQIPTVVTDTTNSVYTGSLLTVKVGVEDGITYSVPVETQAFASGNVITWQTTEAGSYSIVFSLVNKNYAWKSGETGDQTAIWNVAAADVEISFVNGREVEGIITYTSTYGTDYTVFATSTFGTVNLSYFKDKTELHSKPTEAGMYKVVATVEGDGNNFKTATKEATIVIDKAILKVTPEATMVYGDALAENNCSYSVTGFVDSKSKSDVVATDLRYTVVGEVTGVGTYGLKVSGNFVLDNYTFECETGTLTVGKRAIVLVIGDISVNYTQGFEMTNALSENSTLVGTDTVDALGITLQHNGRTDKYGFIPSGVYTISGSISANDVNRNYEISFELGRLNISQLEIDVTFNTVDGVYGEKSALVAVKDITAQTALSTTLKQAILDSIQLHYSGLCNDGDSVFGNVLPTKAGNYVVTVSAVDGNFVVSQASTAPFAIARKTLKESEISAQAQTYTGREIQPQITDDLYSDLYTVSHGRIVEAGDYKLRLKLNDSANMQWANVSGDTYDLPFTVNKKVIDESTITIETLTYTYTGKVFNTGLTDTEYYSVSGHENIKNAGNYTVVFTLTNDSTRWKNTEDRDYSVVITVKKAQNQLDGKVEISGWTYGEYDSTVNAPKASAKFDADTAVVTFSYSGDNGQTWSASIPSHAGSYLVRAEIAETENCLPYRSDTERERFTIMPKRVATPQLVTITSGEHQNVLYTGSELKLSVAFDASIMRLISDVDNGMKATSYDGGADLFVINANVTGYKVTFRLFDAENYVWEDSTTDTVVVTWIVARKQIEQPKAAEKTTFFMDGKTYTYDAIGFDSATMTMTDGESTQAGDYKAVIAISDKVNYEWADGTQTDLSFDWRIIGQGVIFAIVFGTLGSGSAVVGGVFIARIVKHRRLLKTIVEAGECAAEEGVAAAGEGAANAAEGTADAASDASSDTTTE